jgi:GAF domain-containing protein
VVPNHAEFPIRNDEPLVVLDTLLDWRFKCNVGGKQSHTESPGLTSRQKVVTDELDVRFYAGVPIKDEDGRNIGVFCVLDNKPREEFSPEDRAQLKELGTMTMRELHGRVKQVCSIIELILRH